jgi:hypothetical protein
MASNFRKFKKITGGFEANLKVVPHGALPGVTPQKRTLILLDHGEGGFEQRGRVTLPLIIRESGHATQAVLVLVGEILIALKVEGGHTHKLFIDEGTQMKRQFILISWVHTILDSAKGPQHLESQGVRVDRFNS